MIIIRSGNDIWKYDNNIDNNNIWKKYLEIYYLEQGRMAPIGSISLAPIASNEMSSGRLHTVLNHHLDDIITIQTRRLLKAQIQIVK